MKLQAWLDLLEKRHPQAIDLGLERCGLVYTRLGSPRPAQQVFTVAGTNGKGSTVAYLAAMSGALGQRCGSYTSPHIFRFNERVRIMGEAVSDACLTDAFEQVEAARGDTSLTYFEFTTLAALLIMERAALDCAVLEVGLGGRLDTVNLVDADCVVITPIGLDHQDFLGPDLDSIATEKAGIMRPRVMVVSSQADPPAPILDTAQRLGAPLFRRGMDFELVQVAAEDSGLLQFSMGGQSMCLPRPAMAGKHQADNLAAALAALVLVNPDAFSKGGDIAGAVSTCRLPGRLQRVARAPEILLDVGHNELAAEVVATFLARRERRNVTCVLAMLADKPAEAVALVLDKVCGRWICADSPGDRGQAGEALAGRLKAVLPAADVSFFGSLDTALGAAISHADEAQTVLVFGSFTTVSAAAHWLQDSMQRNGYDAARIT